VSQTVDHVVILDKGRLVTMSSLDSLTTRSSHAQVVVRTPDAHRLRSQLVARGIDASVDGDCVTALRTTPEAVGQVIGSNGVAVHEMRLERPALEDVFLSLTNGTANHSDEIDDPDNSDNSSSSNNSNEGIRS
jgi:ABC-2 type transport system ATP-binding protein